MLLIFIQLSIFKLIISITILRLKRSTKIGRLNLRWRFRDIMRLRLALNRLIWLRSISVLSDCLILILTVLRLRFIKLMIQLRKAIRILAMNSSLLANLPLIFIAICVCQLLEIVRMWHHLVLTGGGNHTNINIWGVMNVVKVLFDGTDRSGVVRADASSFSWSLVKGLILDRVSNWSSRMSRGVLGLILDTDRVLRSVVKGVFKVLSVKVLFFFDYVSFIGFWVLLILF